MDLFPWHAELVPFEKVGSKGPLLPALRRFGGLFFWAPTRMSFLSWASREKKNTSHKGVPSPKKKDEPPTCLLGGSPLEQLPKADLESWPQKVRLLFLGPFGN